MKIRTGLAALLVPAALAVSACGAQQGCFDDGEQVSCNQGDDDDDDEGFEYDD